jgi:tetratricopeptide (TPR) repeat protein
MGKFDQTLLRACLQRVGGVLQKAIEINPRLWKAYAALGANLMRIGEEKAAKEILDRGFENDPFNVWTYNTLKLIDSYANFDESKTASFSVRLHQKESKLLANYVPDLLEEAFQTLSNKYQFTPGKPIYFEMFPDHEDFAVRTVETGLGRWVCSPWRGMDSPSAAQRNLFNCTLWVAASPSPAGTDRVPAGLKASPSWRDIAPFGWGDDLNLRPGQKLPDRELNRFPSAQSPDPTVFQAGRTVSSLRKIRLQGDPEDAEWQANDLTKSQTGAQ